MVLERVLQRIKTGRPSHKLKTMALNFFLTQRDGQSSAVSTDCLSVLFPDRFLVLVKGFNTLRSTWLQQYEALLSVTSLPWFLPSPLRLDGTLGFPSEEYQTCGKGPTSHVLYRIKRDICGQTYPTGPVFLLKRRDLDMPSDLHSADFIPFTAAICISVFIIYLSRVLNSYMFPSHP